MKNLITKKLIRTGIVSVAFLVGTTSSVVQAEAVAKVGVCHATGQPESPNYKIVWVPGDTADSHVSNHPNDMLLGDDGMCGGAVVGGMPLRGTGYFATVHLRTRG